MVRLIHLEGFTSGDSIYNADSAYVDVLLTQIGTKGKGKGENPPKLDLALQQVYYFIISQDQLFSYKLVFKVNTFDESFRRTVSGEVEVDLFDELKKHIFTGTEVILSKDIQPASHQVCCIKFLTVAWIERLRNVTRDEKTTQRDLGTSEAESSWIAKRL